MTEDDREYNREERPEKDYSGTSVKDRLTFGEQTGSKFDEKFLR